MKKIIKLWTLLLFKNIKKIEIDKILTKLIDIFFFSIDITVNYCEETWPLTNFEMDKNEVELKGL